MSADMERLLAALARAESAEREIVERLIAQSARLHEALRERDEALRALEEMRKYTDGGLRDEPCACGLISLCWYRHCPRCGVPAPAAPPESEGRGP